MSDIEILFQYRLQQASETLNDPERMLSDNYSPRSIVNRAYYVVYYSLLALYIKTNINVRTSKHAGIISIFDKEFVHKGIFNQKYSKIVHYLFELRQEFDYKELIEVSHKDASDCVNKAKDFFAAISESIA
ncbi:MAG: HEPN domain-containing protein [Spirochaetota bacterium]